MKVFVALYNGRGASAGIESENEDSFTVARGMSYSANKACKLAAERLRKMADRFDELAYEPDPFHINTHKEINRRVSSG